MIACTRRKLLIAKNAPILGVDVGEDWLDLAMLTPDRVRLSYHRVPLAGVTKPVVDSMATRIAEVLDCDLRGGFALVDSPRTPRDADCSSGKIAHRIEAPAARVIDASLRELLRARFKGEMRLSMFPTPLVSYFAGCVARSGCKPHLRAIAEELLAPLMHIPRATASIAGGTFTRFMLAGFAVFPALERLGFRAFESYPDLQMRLWSEGAQIAPKGKRAEALRVRRIICARLACIVGAVGFAAPKTLDEADAAVLALSAAAGSLIELHHPAEGRFALALDKARSGGFQR